jgi:hypothetical protein
MARKRRNPNARSTFHETVLTGGVIATAPTFLETEMARKIPDVAQREGLPSELLEKHWIELQTHIKFEDVVVSEADVAARDPKDVPYLRLHQQTKRPIYTNDSDLKGMAAVVVSGEVLVRIRDYNRHSSVEFSVKFGSTVVAGITLVALLGLWRACAATYGAFTRLPTGVQLFILAAITVALIHPKSRTWFRECLSEASPRIAAAAQSLLEIAEPMILAYAASRTEAARLATSLRSEIDGAAIHGDPTLARITGEKLDG